MTRKLSGGVESRRKLKSSRSIKLANVKGMMRSTRQGKNQTKASLSHSETVNYNDDQISRSPSGNSQKVITRKLSLRPVRISTRMSTFKTRKSCTEKRSSQILQSPDLSLHKATCSSTLKDSHFPDQIEIPLEGSESQGVLSTRKVCPYTYCSLHGGHGDNVPPLKRFVSMRRRQMKTQKNMKMENRPVTRSKQSGNTKKRSQTIPSVHNEDPAKKTGHSGRSHSVNVEKPPRDTPASTNTDSGSSEAEDEEKKNFRCNAEVLLGETSFPHVSFDEYLNDSLAENGYSLSSFLAIRETSKECCCTPTEKDKPDSKMIETEGNDNQVAEQKKNDESTKSIVMDDQPDISTKDASLFGVHSLLTDHREGATLKLTEPESSGENLNANDFTSSNQHDVVELSSTTAAMLSASKLDKLEEERTAEDKSTDPDYVMLRGTSTQREPKPPVASDVSHGMKEEDKRYVKMWHLMYKHAVLSNAGKDPDRLPSDGEKEGQGKDDKSFNEVDSSSCQDTDDENEKVVKLVQKAFDEILLPEKEDFSFDEHIKSRGKASDEEHQEVSHGNEDDGDAATSTECPREESWPKVDNSQSHEEKKTEQSMGNKSDPRKPKSWSNLKKLLLLKRFVKALEKVRNLNLRKRGHLPSDASREAEKVSLRPLTAEEKKNVEEWMLDYALQKVISKLAPAQKQRVSLLVEAFETVLPFQDTELLLGKALRSHKSTEEHAESAGDNPIPKYQYSIGIEEGRFDHSLTETVKNDPTSRDVEGDRKGYQGLASSHDNGENNTIVDENVRLSETNDSVLLSYGTPADIISTFQDGGATTNEIVNEDTGDLVSDSAVEVLSSKSESHGSNLETKNLISASEEPLPLPKSLILRSFAKSLQSNLVSSAAPLDRLEEPTTDRKESIVNAKPETENLEQYPTAEETEIQQEKQNHTGLWYLIYKHMASGIAANDFKPLVDGDTEKETRYDDGRVTGTNTCEPNQDMPSKHHIADPEAELRQIEAIRIVEEAIDAILPDVQEHSSDGQSVTDNMVSGNSKQSHRTEGVCGEDLNHKEERATSGDGINQERDEEEPTLNKGNKPLSRSWSNLKKVIMLRRFIKALEKVKKFNPREPKYLPVESDPEAEKVNLRHQGMGERKGSEEWMLDHALRQVVAQLTPARKKKVELLVEAFETVMPTIKP